MPVIINGTTGITNVNGSAAAPAETGVDTDTGIFFPAANTLAFSTGGTEDARFDSAGNFGIGTTSPSTILAFGGNSDRVVQVERTTLAGTSGSSLSIKAGGAVSGGSNLNGGDLFLYTGVATGNGVGNMRFYTYTPGSSGTADTTASEKMRLDSSGNLGVGSTSPTQTSGWQQISIDSASGSGSMINIMKAGSRNARFYSDGSDCHVGSFSNIPFVLDQNNSERARINTYGYFKASNNATYVDGAGQYHEFYGGGANGYTVIVTSPLATPLSQYMLDLRFSAATPNNGSARFWSATDASAVRAYLRSDGGLANYSANNVNLSDAREKKDIELADDYLAKICAIPVKTFLYNDQTDEDKNLGVIAQDVQAVAPELVMESNWGTQEEPKMRLSIYQTDLQYALMKCIQEQQAIITQLQADVAALKAKA